MCHIHIALYHVQQQLKSSDPKQLYKRFTRVYRTALVYIITKPFDRKL